MKSFCALKSLAAMGSMIVLSACMDIRAVDRNRDHESAGPAPAAQDFTAVPAGAWNHFHVHIPARYVQGPVMRMTKGLHGESLTEKLPRNLAAVPGEFIDADLVGGQTFEYTFFSGNNNEEPKKVEFTVPLDLEVSPNLLKDKAQTDLLLTTKKFGRLIFKPDVLVETLGADWIIEASDIEFNRTVFKSFVRASTARPGAEGRSGGRIEIHAAKATGQVQFLLSGETGGQGDKGAAPDASLRGTNGQPGGDGEVHIDGGQALGGMTSYRCSTRPGPGSNGGDGHTGFQGGRGYAGGDSGEVRLFIADHQLLDVAARLSPGTGGPGGPGGEGGEGGAGGASGSQQRLGVVGTFTNCEPSGSAQSGRRGLEGPIGNQGPDGITQKACFIVPGQGPSCF